jgi:hypothetical protein
MECKAVMEQKDAKGKKCWRPAKENGYCGITAFLVFHILLYNIFHNYY